jgi:hypothetical protein
LQQFLYPGDDAGFSSAGPLDHAVPKSSKIALILRLWPAEALTGSIQSKTQIQIAGACCYVRAHLHPATKTQIQRQDGV